MSENKKKKITLIDYAKFINQFIEIYKDQHGEHMVYVRYENIRQYFGIEDLAFSRICIRIIANRFESIIDAGRISSIINYFIAEHDSIKTQQFFHRTITMEGDEVVYNLSNEFGECVAIKKDSIKILDRTKHKLPFYTSSVSGVQVKPDLDASVNDVNMLFDFVALKEYQRCERLLVIANITYAIMGGSAYPILTVQGEKGSAKSSAARYIMEIVDPKSVTTMHMSYKAEDVLVAALSHKSLILDNLSKITLPQSDLLCQLSTGGGLMKRKLYSDKTLTQYNVCNPIIITSINQVFTQDDVISRALHIGMHKITAEGRKCESELAEAFAVLKPKILGGYFKLIQKVLEIKGQQNIESVPTRLADFYKIAVAVEFILGYPEKTLDKALVESSQRLLCSSNIDNSIIFGIYDITKKNGGKWEGLFSDLMDELRHHDNELFIPSNTSLSKTVRKRQDALESIGVMTTFAEKNPNQIWVSGKRSVRFTLPDFLCDNQKEVGKV